MHIILSPYCVFVFWLGLRHKYSKCIIRILRWILDKVRAIGGTLMNCEIKYSVMWKSKAFVTNILPLLEHSTKCWNHWWLMYTVAPLVIFAVGLYLCYTVLCDDDWDALSRRPTATTTSGFYCFITTRCLSAAPMPLHLSAPGVR